MADWALVERCATALPAVAGGRMYQDWRVWRVRDKTIAWERPLGQRDRAGIENPWESDILAIQVADVDQRDAMVADDPELFFTIPHFAGYPAVLIRLGRLTEAELRGLLADAWRLRATKTLLRAHPEIGAVLPG